MYDLPMAMDPALRLAGAVADGVAGAGRLCAGAALGVTARLGSLFVGWRPLRWSYLGPLFERSVVMRDATVTLHRARVARRPGFTPPHGLGRKRGFTCDLDITVRPRMRRGQKGFAWSPADLVLVAPGARAAHPEEDEQVGIVVGASVWSAGRFQQQNAARPLLGPQRVRLRVGMEPAARRFHFRYYLELLKKRRPSR